MPIQTEPRHRRTSRHAAAIAITTFLTAGIVAVGPAVATSARVEHFTARLALRANSDQPAWSSAATHGAFRDRGAVRFGADGPHGVHHDILNLRNGTVDLAEISKSDDFYFNPKTCVGTDQETGTYRISGTGKYSQLTGHGTWRHDATLVAPIGPHCRPDSARTVGFVRFSATGPVSLRG